MSFTKNVVLNLYSLIKLFFQKISDVFWHRKLTLKYSGFLKEEQFHSWILLCYDNLYLSIFCHQCLELKRQLRICPDLALFYQLAKLQFFFSVKPWLGAIDHHQLSSKRRTNNLGNKVEMDIYSQTSLQLRIASQFLAIFSCFAEIMLWVLNLLSEIWFNFLCFLTTSMYNYWNWHMKINPTVHWFNENYNFFFLEN